MLNEVWVAKEIIIRGIVEESVLAVINNRDINAIE